MHDVTAWLQELGLAKYAERLQNDAIDFDTLPQLTDSRLKQLGVPPGARTKLLAAISVLHGSTTSAAAAPSISVRTRESAPLDAKGERRQITVVFVDIVDSTKLATTLDPEDLTLVMRSFQHACGEVIARYGGHIAQYLGDAIMVYFGWPIAHEDAAERAVRASLEIIEEIKGISDAGPLSVRVGISTGIVVVSGTASGDPSLPSGAIGETPHVASRLQNIAKPDSVVVAESTKRLVSARFDMEALGAQALKGIIEPIYAFRVHGLQNASRFEAAHSQELTPLVGRNSELALLKQRWRDTLDGEGQFVLISGVPGIGKSRIVYELETSIGVEQAFTLRLQCLPHCMQSAFFPVVQQMERLATIKSEDSAEARFAKLRHLLLRATDEIDQVLPSLAGLISEHLDSRGRPMSQTDSPEKSQVLSALLKLLLAASDRKPVLCILEDAQWIDPSTQELLDLVIDGIQNNRVLLLVTSRPEYHPRVSHSGEMTAITLPRLARRQVAHLARLALRDRPVSEQAMQRLIDDSDSIPLFVEELAHGASESQGLRNKRDAGVNTASSPDWVVPETLRDSLMARLDRAPMARSVAQAASVIGREFERDILSSLVPMNSSELDEALAHLQANEIVRKIDKSRSGSYAFKHALVRDAAYDSLLKSSRREIHGRVGAVIEKQRLEIVAGQPELLAYHYDLAGNTSMSLRYWWLGGQRARNRSAYLEAVDMFQKALACLALLPEDQSRNEFELDIQLSLGLCNVAVRGYSGDETRESFDRAYALSTDLDQLEKQKQAIFGLWGHHWMRAQHDRATELAKDLINKAEQRDDAAGRIIGHRCLGSTLFTLGDFVQAREHLEKTISLAQQGGIDMGSTTYAVDPMVAAQLMLAWDLWVLGYPAQALENARDALKQATEEAIPYGMAFAQYVMSAVLLLRGEYRQSLEFSEQSLQLSTKHRISLYALYSRFGQGCALAALGELSNAATAIRESIDKASQASLGYMRAFMLGWLAAVQLAMGDPEAASATLGTQSTDINDTSGRAWEAEVLRLRGDVLLASHPENTSDARRCYRESISVAQRQQARSLELRAATSLARLLKKEGDNHEAHQVLRPIYDWFTEGLETADLKQARILLDDLGEKET